MSLHQISGGSRIHPQTHDGIERRMLEILRDRVAVEQQWGLPSPAIVVHNHGTPRRDICLPAWVPRGPLGHCYTNALRAVFASAGRDLELAYVEGYAYMPHFDLIIEHAWVEDPGGNVFEVTWPPDEARAYIGIPIRLHDLHRALAIEQEPILFGDWSRGFPFLRSHSGCCDRGSRSAALWGSDAEQARSWAAGASPG